MSIDTNNPQGIGNTCVKILKFWRTELSYAQNKNRGKMMRLLGMDICPNLNDIMEIRCNKCETISKLIAQKHMTSLFPCFAWIYHRRSWHGPPSDVGVLKNTWK
jgi:hypothetical protein